MLKKHDLAGLAQKPSGRKEGNPKWDKEPFDALAQEIDKGGYWSVPRMQEWLKKEYKKNIPEQTVWYRMDTLGYSYKSARPHPVQGDRERQETFKKGASPHSWSR
jgi:transposase